MSESLSECICSGWDQTFVCLLSALRNIVCPKWKSIWIPIFILSGPGHFQNVRFPCRGRFFKRASSGSLGKHPNEKWMFCSVLPVLWVGREPGEHSCRCQGEAALAKTTETAERSLVRSTAWQSDNSTPALCCMFYVLCSPDWPKVFGGNGVDALMRQAWLCEGTYFSCGGAVSAFILVEKMRVCKFSGERSLRTTTRQMHEIIGLHYARTVSVSVLWITSNMKHLSQGFSKQPKLITCTIKTLISLCFYNIHMVWIQWCLSNIFVCI